MYTKDWYWYVLPCREAQYFVRQVRRWDEFLREKKQTNFRKLGFLETILKDVRIVAKKYGNAGKKSASTNQEIQWLSAPINTENEPECLKWMDDNASQSMGFICALASRGFSVSLKPSRNDDYMGTIYGSLARGDTITSVGISAFAANPEDAILGVLCKFIFLLDWGANAEIGLEKPISRFR